MSKVGVRALMVAVIGVIMPFVLGSFILGPILFGDESSNARLFLGASLVATSVGITASVFRSLKLSKSRAAKTVLGAAVIDDVLGLIVLAVVSALVSGDALSAGLIATLVFKSFGFLIGALVLGVLIAKPISRLFSKIHTGIGMKVTLAIGFALVFGYLAELFGLEPIIGAFAAGLLLDAVHFESFSDPEIINDIKKLEVQGEHGVEIAKLVKKHRHAHVEDLVNSIGLIFIPVFFVYTGMQIDFGSLLQPKLYLIAAIIAVFAIATKLVAGIAAPGTKTEKIFVGVSMVPRGEVGLIFAATGSSLGVLSSELFSTIVLVVITTTFVAPALIKHFGGKLKAEAKAA
jgi:Kef-type K+ transport system membrane component KefB